MATSAASKAVAAPGEATIVVTRTIDAPRDLVWKVWTDPEHVGKWWGPNGFSTTTSAIEVKVGGVWLFTMHGPDGTDYPNRIVYREIKKPERLAYDHGDESDGEQFRTVVTFSEDGDRTRVRMVATFPSVAARDAVAKFAVEGAEQHLDNAAAYVATRALAGRRVVLTRTFAAPRDLVFRMWTEPKHMVAWWGPRGNRNPECTLDARPGGAIHMRMVGDGYDNALGGEFIEVDPPKRLVFLAFGVPDERGEFQIRNHNVLTFEEADGITTMRLECTVQYAAPALAEALDFMEEGWSQSLDKLLELVARETMRRR